MTLHVRKNVAVLGKTTTCPNSRFFGQREYKDKFSVSFFSPASVSLFNKSQLVSYELENHEVNSYPPKKLIIQKSIHILKGRFLLSHQARLAGTELHLAGRECVWFVAYQRFPVDFPCWAHLSTRA